MTELLKLDTKIKKAFQNLLTQIDNIGRITRHGYRPSFEPRGDDVPFTEVEINTEHFEAVRIQCILMVNMLSSQQNTDLKDVCQRVQMLRPDPYDLNVLKGIVVGLKQSYEAGLLDSLIQIIEADISADYLGQAEQLLKEGQSGKHDHIPAAVLTGAILEDTLRRLCRRQNPPIPTVKSNGEPKTLNTYIDDLKKAGVFNELKAKQLRSWADIRNAAAHGEFEKFKRQDVEQMLVGVQNFIADYL